MKIGIATFYESLNYGTVLQAYALQKQLFNLGHEAELIQIRRDWKGGSKQNQPKKRKYSFFEKLIIKYNSFLTIKDEEKKAKVFERFRRENLIESKEIFQGTNIEIFNGYDVLLSGGDQIWNPYHKTFSLNYFFFNADKNIPKIAHGSSFGVERIEEQETLDSIKNELLGYTAIAVRETSGVQLLKEIGVEAVSVLDPVFLLDKSQWLHLTKSCRKPKKKYCLVYSLVDFCDEDKKAIKEYARRNRLEVKIMPRNSPNLNNFFKKEFSATPEEFLSLIYNAERVFTNSFHGTAFSILFDKQFTLLTPSFEGAKKRSVRMSNFLNLLGLNAEDCWKIRQIDYSSVHITLSGLIENSKEILHSNLEKVKEGL